MTETPLESYANELRREIMRSEIQRVRMLAIVLSVLLAATIQNSMKMRRVSVITPVSVRQNG